jgi:hypothetical protein
MAKPIPLSVAQRIVAPTDAALVATTRTCGESCVRVLYDVSKAVEALLP